MLGIATVLEWLVSLPALASAGLCMLLAFYLGRRRTTGVEPAWPPRPHVVFILLMGVCLSAIPMLAIERLSPPLAMLTAFVQAFGVGVGLHLAAGAQSVGALGVEGRAEACAQLDALCADRGDAPASRERGPAVWSDADLRTVVFVVFGVSCIGGMLAAGIAAACCTAFALAASAFAVDTLRYRIVSCREERLVLWRRWDGERAVDRAALIAWRVTPTRTWLRVRLDEGRTPVVVVLPGTGT